MAETVSRNRDLLERMDEFAPAAQAQEEREAVLRADIEFVRDLLWAEHPECCGCPVEDYGGEYMGQREVFLSCCGSPDAAMLNDAQIVASLRARFPEILPWEPLHELRQDRAPAGTSAASGMAASEKGLTEGGNSVESAKPPGYAAKLEQALLIYQHAVESGMVDADLRAAYDNAVEVLNGVPSLSTTSSNTPAKE